MSLRFVPISLLLFFTLPAIAGAQFLGGAVSINSQPSYPQPGETVTLTLDAYSYDTVGADITWRVDGEVQSSAANQPELVLEAGPLGTAQTVTATVALRDGTTRTAEHTLRPTRTNLTIEAKTHSPSFYKGRSEPSSGSVIRAVAIPETGSNSSPQSYSYRWETGGEVLFGGPVQGKNIVEFPAPLGREATIRLDVLDPASGRTVASTIEYVPIIQPEVYFYEESLLRGLSRNAIGETYNLLSDEVSLHAEPYFISSEHLQANPRIVWKMNSETIANPNENPFVITLRQTGGSGRANVSFSVRSREALSQYATNMFTVAF